MTPHMRLQRIATGMITRLALTLAPLAHIFRLLRPSCGAMGALHVLDELVVVGRFAELAVLP